MAQYVAFIYDQDVDWSQPTGDQMSEMAEYSAFGEAAASVIRGGAVLYPTASSTTVRVSGGKGGDVLSTDGPFADTKEVLTGFYILECADLDEAIETASRIPAAWGGGAVEVRPVIPMM